MYLNHRLHGVGHCILTTILNAKNSCCVLSDCVNVRTESYQIYSLQTNPQRAVPCSWLYKSLKRASALEISPAASWSWKVCQLATVNLYLFVSARLHPIVSLLTTLALPHRTEVRKHVNIRRGTKVQQVSTYVVSEVGRDGMVLHSCCRLCFSSRRFLLWLQG